MLVGVRDRFELLELLWKQYKFLSGQIEQVEAKTRLEMEPHRELIELLEGVPGMDEMVAWTLIAERGTDMGVFPTTGQVASWAGMCPGTNESAGKQMNSKTRKGNRYLRRALLHPAWAATRKKDTYLRAFFQRRDVSQRLGQGDCGWGTNCW